jgi:hypothetical protein
MHIASPGFVFPLLCFLIEMFGEPAWSVYNSPL